MAHLARAITPLRFRERDRNLAPAQIPATSPVILLSGARDIDGLRAVGGRDHLTTLAAPGCFRRRSLTTSPAAKVPGGRRRGLRPETYLALARPRLLEAVCLSVCRGLFSLVELVMPGEARPEHLPVDILLPEQHLAERAPVPVRLLIFDRDLFTEHEIGEVLFRLRAEVLTAFRRVDTLKPDAVLLAESVEDGDGVAVGDGHHLARQNFRLRERGQTEQE